MRVRLCAGIFGSVVLACVQPAMAQAPTCTTSGSTMTCTFPAGGTGSDSFWTASGNSIYTTNPVNVGIGTSSPTRRLDIQGQDPALRIKNTGAGGRSWIIANGLQTSNDGKFAVYDETVNAARFVIDLAGSVGVGTMSPTGLFTVVGSTAASAVDIDFGNNATSTTNNEVRLRLPTYAGAVGSPAAAPYMSAIDVDGTSGASDLAFGTVRGDATTQEVMRMTNTGNVGIGTSTPGAKLDLNGAMAVSNDSAIYFRRAGGALDANIREGAGGNLDIVSPATGNVFFSNHTDATVNMVVSDGGNVHMTGNLMVDGNVSARYQDVAEWVRARNPLPAGTVVVADKGGVVDVSKKSYDTAVVGVVSPQPGLVLGEAGEDKVLVAQSGRVRVKVDASYGAVREGDLLVTSPKPGIAMRSKPLNVGGASFHRPGTLLGKALEPLPSGQGEILVLLTLQ